MVVALLVLGTVAAFGVGALACWVFYDAFIRN